MAVFVLVPGFWFGGELWDTVARDLRAGGHEVRAVTLTGMGGRAQEASPEVDMDTHTADVVEAIGEERVILAGHSYGGMVAAQAADRVPDRVAHAVYVDSAPLPDGSRQFDMHPPNTQEEIEKRVAAEGDGWRLPPPAFTDVAGDPSVLKGLGEDDLALMRSTAVPQPFATALSPMRRSGRGRSPETLVACTFPEEEVRRMIADRHPMYAGFGDDLTVVALPTGHYPMLSRPSDTAAILASLA